MSLLDPEWSVIIKQRVKEARELIKVKETVQALQAFALGEDIDGTKVRLNKEQIRAAEILLKKILPDLKAVEVTGANGGAVKVETIVIRAVDAADDRTTQESI